MSLSRKARMSRMPWRSMAMRSVPMPKAKPWYLLGIEPAVAQHDRMDHARAEDRQPAGALARRAAVPPQIVQLMSNATDGSVNG